MSGSATIRIQHRVPNDAAEAGAGLERATGLADAGGLDDGPEVGVGERSEAVREEAGMLEKPGGKRNKGGGHQPSWRAGWSRDSELGRERSTERGADKEDRATRAGVIRRRRESLGGGDKVWRVTEKV